MKKIFLIVVIALGFPYLIQAQGWPSEVTLVPSKPNDSVIVSGELANGRIIDDLRWASSSTNACFVATQNTKFRGNHVFYYTTIPPHSIMNISVTPTDPAGDLSMYAYMTTLNEHRLVPDLPSCITCEADYKWDGNWKGKVQTGERKVEFNNPTDQTYQILIGVSAPKGVTTGQFNVKVKLKS